MTKATVSKPVTKTAASAPQAESESSGPIWKTQNNRVKGAMWRHQQPGDKVRFTVSISRSYKDEKNAWVNTHFFDERDLRDVVLVANEARDQILGLRGMTTEPGED
jgi:hypothetical protein